MDFDPKKKKQISPDKRFYIYAEICWFYSIPTYNLIQCVEFKKRQKFFFLLLLNNLSAFYWLGIRSHPSGWMEC